MFEVSRLESRPHDPVMRSKKNWQAVISLPLCAWIYILAFAVGQLPKCPMGLDKGQSMLLDSWPRALPSERALGLGTTLE